MISKIFLIFLVSVLTVIMSCGGQERSIETEDGGGIDKDKINAFKYSVELIDAKALNKLIAQRNDTVLFLNVWASWCIPCREEFPDLIKLVKNYREKPVDFAGISADYPDELDSKVVPFLSDFEVNFKNYIQNFEKQEEFINRLNPEWNGGLPATFIFDRKGKLRQFLLGKQDFRTFKQELDKVLQTS